MASRTVVALLVAGGLLTACTDERSGTTAPRRPASSSPGAPEPATSAPRSTEPVVVVTHATGPRLSLSRAAARGLLT
ncbi:MAG: hypothetical protein HOQ45_08055, partial [Nocardioidaceae bacterium]|nr:hypothetical protein [Nocardioidaceae bacterium]